MFLSLLLLLQWSPFSWLLVAVLEFVVEFVVVVLGDHHQDVVVVVVGVCRLLPTSFSLVCVCHCFFFIMLMLLLSLLLQLYLNVVMVAVVATVVCFPGRASLQTLPSVANQASQSGWPPIAGDHPRKVVAVRPALRRSSA